MARVCQSRVKQKGGGGFKLQINYMFLLHKISSELVAIVSMAKYTFYCLIAIPLFLNHVQSTAQLKVVRGLTVLPTAIFFLLVHFFMTHYPQSFETYLLPVKKTTDLLPLVKKRKVILL